MDGIKRLESLPLDAPEFQLIPSIEKDRLTPALLGQHPYDLSFGHSERWVYYDGGKPVGLLIISVIPDFRTGAIEWIFVKETHRKQAIATALLKGALFFLKEKSITALTLYYQSNEPYLDAICALLKKYHTTTPRPFVKKFKFDVPNFNPKWLWKDLPIPEGYSFFPWGEITEVEKRKLEHRVDQMEIYSPLSPFLNPEKIDLKTSLGIRNSEGVVGWSVTHWVNPENLEFSSLYIDPELASTGLGFTALVRSIRLLKLDPPPWAWAIYRMRSDHPPAWENFVVKRLTIEAVEVVTIDEVSIIL